MAEPYADEDLLPLSALQHLVFCERQCALIHLEQVWADNVLTAEGHLLHERTDQPGEERRGDRRTSRAVPLVHRGLGLVGKADTVEWHRAGPAAWHAVPVEYKRGRSKPHDADRIQLCAQALCLEEMLGKTVPEGALFYGAPRRREAVTFDAPLRQATEQAAYRLRALIEAGVTPPAQYDARCRNCSLIDLCRPKLSSGGGKGARKRKDSGRGEGRVARWLQAALDEAAGAG